MPISLVGFMCASWYYSLAQLGMAHTLSRYANRCYDWAQFSLSSDLAHSNAEEYSSLASSPGFLGIPTRSCSLAPDPMHAIRCRGPAWHSLPSVLAFTCACGCCSLAPSASFSSTSHEQQMSSCQVSSVAKSDLAHHHPQLST